MGLRAGRGVRRGGDVRLLIPRRHCRSSVTVLNPRRTGYRTSVVRVVSLHADYQAKATDSEVLRRPLKSELQSHEIRNVFGFPRNLRDRYLVAEVLGAGSFGVVRHCTERSSGKKYAVKSIPKMPKNHKCTPRYLLKLQTEVDAMGQIGSSLDAVYLKDVFEDDAAVHLVMELCEGGSVLDGLKGNYSERQVASIMRSVLRFLSQCHAKGIVYRDVKPENFMLLHRHEGGGAAGSTVHKDGRSDAKREAGRGLWKTFSKAVGIRGGDSSDADGEVSGVAGVAPPASLGGGAALEPEAHLQVKATDFGLSIRHRNDEPPLKSRSGTPAYMAPEVIKQAYTEKADVWSAGIMMYQLLTGKFPFWENVRECTLQQVWKSILTEQVDFEAAELSHISPEAVNLLRQMLHRDQNRRASANEALHHPWLAVKDAAPALPLRSSVIQRLQRFATYGKLKQLVLKLIADDIHEDTVPMPVVDAGTSENSVMILRALSGLFEELDVDDSGCISKGELLDGLERLGYEIDSNELDQLISRVDTNKDGSLQLSEFTAGMIDWPAMQEDSRWDTWVNRAFDKLDQNGDGFIELGELESLIGASMRPLYISEGDNDEAERILEARNMLREADTNGDGLVSREEFAELLTVGGTEPDLLFLYDTRLRGGLGASDVVASVDGDFAVEEEDWRES